MNSQPRWKVLVSAPYMQPVIDRFRPFFHKNQIEIVVPPVNERMEEDELLACIGDIDGAVCGDDRFTERVLASAPRLKVISKWGTGIDSIDQEACARLGIAVCNTPNAFSEPVADSVFGYMLAFARSIPWMDRDMKAGHWQKIPGRALNESTLGIVGMGNVGRAVARRAGGFGLSLLGTDPRPIPASVIEQTRIHMVALDELLDRSDFVSINCDLNPSSHHLMNRATFARMKETAVLINTARGPVVHEADLVQALQRKQIGGAALDVFEEEPLPSDSPLHQMENVLLAPHNSNSSPSAWERVHQATLHNLVTELQERTP